MTVDWGPGKLETAHDSSHCSEIVRLDMKYIPEILPLVVHILLVVACNLGAKLLCEIGHRLLRLTHRCTATLRSPLGKDIDIWPFFASIQHIPKASKILISAASEESLIKAEVFVYLGFEFLLVFFGSESVDVMKDPFCAEGKGRQNVEKITSLVLGKDVIPPDYSASNVHKALQVVKLSGVEAALQVAKSLHFEQTWHLHRGMVPRRLRVMNGPSSVNCRKFCYILAPDLASCFDIKPTTHHHPQPQV